MEFESWLSVGMLQHDHLIVKSDLSVLTHIQEWFDQFCLRYAAKSFWLKEQHYPMNLALTEGFTNAVRHAHHELPSETTIEIDLCLWNDRMEIRIWDQGKPFNPDVLEEPEPGTLRQGGYGWFLLRRLADYVVYERSPDNRNCLLIVKHATKEQTVPDKG